MRSAQKKTICDTAAGCNALILCCVVLETPSDKPVAAGLTDKLVAVGTGCFGILSLFDLSTPTSRRQGPVMNLALPGQSGAVTACCFSGSEPMSVSGDSQGDLGLALEEFGVIAGGDNGEIACWDLRNPR